MIVYACADLIFATKVRSTAEALGVATRPVRNGDMLAARLHRVEDGKLNEPVAAVIVDLDLGDDGIALIEQARAHDATLPVIAFGSHVAAELLRHASEVGASRVMPRSAFTAGLPGLLEQYR